MIISRDDAATRRNNKIKEKRQNVKAADIKGTVFKFNMEDCVLINNIMRSALFFSFVFYL